MMGWPITFSGIRPHDLRGFIMGEVAGAIVGMLVMSWLLRPDPAAVPIHPEAKL
jgi:hypothetical protein